MARLAQRSKKGRARGSTRVSNANRSDRSRKEGREASLPTKIKIANLNFKLKFINPDSKEISDSHGWVDFSREIIALNPDQSPESLHDTFLHELIHAVCYVMSVKMEEGDEQMTRRLATGLCMVWKDNRKVFEWWQNLV